MIHRTNVRVLGKNRVHFSIAPFRVRVYVFAYSHPYGSGEQWEWLGLRVNLYKNNS